MKIAVLVKEVPDTYGDRKLNLETGLADRAASDAVVDEIGERALEVVLKYKDATPDAEVVLVSMGPESAQASIRKAIAMGADRAIHVADERLVGADLGLTAQVLANALEREEFDLIVAGNQSTDGSGGVIPAMVAERLGYPHATGLSSLDITESGISGTRPVEGGVAEVEADYPAVVSVTEALPEGRFANFKGIMAAKKKPYEMLSLDDLDIDPDDFSTGRSIMLSIAERPPREAGVKVVDDGTAASQLADFLAKERLI